MNQEIGKLREAFTYAWSSIKVNAKDILTFYALMWVVRDSLLYVGLLTPLSWWVWIVLLLGVTALILGDMTKLNLGLKLTLNQGVVWADLWDSTMTTAKYAVGWMLYFAMVLVGLAVFILPGLWVVMRFQFWGYYVVDRKAGVVTALLESFELTKGKGKQLAVAVLPMALAWIVAAPIALMAHVYTFRKMEMEGAKK